MAEMIEMQLEYEGSLYFVPIPPDPNDKPRTKLFGNLYETPAEASGKFLKVLVCFAILLPNGAAELSIVGLTCNNPRLTTTLFSCLANKLGLTNPSIALVEKAAPAPPVPQFMGPEQ